MKKDRSSSPAALMNRKHSVKILILTAALIIVGVALFLHFYDNYNDNILYAERLNQMQEVTSQLFAGLEDVAKSRWNSAELQRNFLLEADPKSIDELLRYMRKQSVLSNAQSRQLDLIAVDSDGKYYTQGGEKGLLSERRYLTSMPERISYVANAMFANRARMVFLLKLNEPLKMTDTEITYYGVTQDMTELTPYFRCEAYSGSNGMYVVDEQGLKIFSDSPNNKLKGYNIYSVLEKMDYQHGSNFAEAKAELEKKGIVYSNAMLGGEEYYYALYRMNNAKWTLVFMVPSDYVATNTVELVNASTRSILFFAVVMLGISALMIFLLLAQQQKRVLEQEHRNSESLEKINRELAATAEAAERAEQAAKSADKAKSEFLANMSHDIRTPMNAIVGITKLMEHEKNNPEKLDTYIHKVQTSSRHLLGLINDVLDMSKIESSEITLSREPVSLAELIGQIDSILRPQTEEHDQRFVIRVHEIAHEFFISDALRLRQIFINLLSNAVKYTPDGGAVSLDVTELPGEDEEHAIIIISVADTGCGMTPEFAEHIFEPFTRAESSVTNKVQGTGLGMAITKNIIDLMGGTIKVRSKLGEGSRFLIKLPLVIDNTRLNEINSKGILLISEDETFIANARASFRKAGIPFYAAKTKTETDRLLHSGTVDTVLISGYLKDPRLPQIAKYIRSESNNSVLLFCADYAQSDKAADILAHSGIDGLLARPFFLSGLIRIVNRMRSDAAAAEAEEGAVLNGMRFLCAEDNALNAEILEALMDMNGAACVVYPDGEQLVQAFANVKPGEFDAILMDVQMPNMNGLEATRAIRSGSNPLGKTIPIVAMTANAFSSDVRECLDAGMDAHVAKPIDIAVLESALKNLTDIRESGHRISH